MIKRPARPGDETTADRLCVELVVLSKRDEVLALARTPLRLPALAEWLSPLATIVPAQLFAYHLAHAMGHDAEALRGLSKVTQTW